MKKVKQFHLSIIDPEDVPSIAVVLCHNPSVQFSNRRNSVIDERFGPVSQRDKCVQCMSYLNDCVGHFGYIRLCLPVYQPFFLNDVYKIVTKACYNCLRPACGDECEYCNAVQGKWSRELGTRDRFVHKHEYQKRELTVTNVQTILREHDKKFKSKPEQAQPKSWLLLTNLLVLPMAARASIVTQGLVSHHALTHAYASIIKENNLLSIFVGQQQSPHVILQQWRRLQDAVYKLFDARYSNDERFTEGIRQRLDSKAGRFRKHLLGKRCDFSARTVIGGDPSLELGELGVPRSIAMRMTFPEHVNRYNLAEMRACVARGTEELNGALYIVKKDSGDCFDLSVAGSLTTIASQLRAGDIVERMMRDGDYVLFNRQPQV